MVNTLDGPQILCSLIVLMKYDVRMADQYAKCKNLKKTTTKKLKKLHKKVKKLKAKSKGLDKTLK